MKKGIEAFLTPEEEAQVIDEIQRAELKTSGEIRVHLERSTSMPAFNRAQELFHLLKMDNTKDANGVLLYVAVDDHKFSILGDKGINRVVPEGFWESTRDIIQEEFKKGNFKEGLVKGIHSAGEQLRKYFPWEEDDENELSDEISTS